MLLQDYLYILLEDQFSVGDYVRIGQFFERCRFRQLDFVQPKKTKVKVGQVNSYFLPNGSIDSNSSYELLGSNH